MDDGKSQALCLSLLKADSEEDVVSILKKAGLWDNLDAWRPYGGKVRNWQTIGGQQSDPDKALVEKLTNSIDTKIIAAARISNRMSGPSAPKTLFDARDIFFGEQWKDVDTLSKAITVAATGLRTAPSITIVDDGEGVTPSQMPLTILSLHEGNKDEIPFVQGKFNMGGSGVLESCGRQFNVELVLSRKNPKLLDANAPSHERRWSFTIIRREDPSEFRSKRSSTYTYLAPVDIKEGVGSLLTFEAPTLPIFPEKNQAYARMAEWGTLFKLYEYGTRATTNMMLQDGLMMKLRLLLPRPALPIRFHECRDYSGDPKRSFDTPMVGLLQTLDQDRNNTKRQNVEWFDKFDLNVEGETFTVRIYLFRKPGKDEKNPAENYRKDEGVVYTYNGQAQNVLTKDFFRRKRVKQDYLWNSLLVFVDCSAIGERAHEKMFMPNRENSRNSTLKRQVERALEEKLHNHSELKQIAIGRRKAEISESPEVSESFAKFLEEMVKKHPLLEQILGPGFRIANPFKPHIVETNEKPYEGLRFPTKFHFRDMEVGAELDRNAHLESQVRVSFETDAENDYFRRDEEAGVFTLYRVVGDELLPATMATWDTPSLFEGSATLSLALPKTAKIGDQYVFEAHLTDPSQVDPFRNRFTLQVRPARTHPSDPGERRKPKVKEPDGEKKLDDSGLNVPNPQEVYEPKWATQDPKFDKYTAMCVKHPPGAPAESNVYDYFINMDNVFLKQAIKLQPKYAMQHRERFKLGMTLISLALLRYDLEMKSREPKDGDEADEGENEKGPKKQGIQEVVAEVTSAIAPFLLPLVDTLTEITWHRESEPLSASAGEAA